MSGCRCHRVQRRPQACLETYLMAKCRQPRGLATFLCSHDPWDMEVGTCGLEPPCPPLNWEPQAVKARGGTDRAAWGQDSNRRAKL